MSKYDNYGILDCIDELMYVENLSNGFYKRCEKLMRNILPKLNSSSELSIEEYLFLILCFENKLHLWIRSMDEGESKDGYVDIDSNWIEFDETFMRKMGRIVDPIYQNYAGRDVKKLHDILINILTIYKESKQWMIEKGYEV